METKNNNDDDVVKVVSAVSLLSGYYYNHVVSLTATTTTTDNDSDDDHNTNSNSVIIILTEKKKWRPIPPSQQRVIFLKHQSSTALTTDDGITTDDDDDDEDEDEDENEEENPNNNIIKTFQQRIRQQQHNNKECSMKNSSNQYYENLLNDTKQLERILIARKYDIEDSIDLFWEQIRFRVRWQPDQILQQRPNDIQTPLESGAWRLCGYSRNGNIISNYKLKYWDPNAYGVVEYVKYVIYMIELMISKMTTATSARSTVSSSSSQQQKQQPLNDKFIVLFDLKGFVPSCIFQQHVRLMIRKLIYIAQAQYPERLQSVYLLNSPRGFESAWYLIKSILDEKTVSKINFVSRQQQRSPRQRATNSNSSLFHDDEIDPSVLSIEYGGSHPEYPLP